MFPSTSSLPFTPIAIFALAGAAAAVVAICALLGLFSSGPGATPSEAPTLVAEDGRPATVPAVPPAPKPGPVERPTRIPVVKDDDPPPPAVPTPTRDVRFATFSGAVVDRATGEPMAGVTVECRYAGDAKAPPVRATTDAAGRYELALRRGARVRIAYTKAGYAELLRGPVVPDARAGLAGGVRLARPAKTIPTGKGRVIGIVRNAKTGRPVAGAVIALCLDSGGSKFQQRTNAQGQFGFDWQASRKHGYEILVRSKGLAEVSSAAFNVAEGSMTLIELFAAPARTVVRGGVKDAITGAVIIGAKVELKRWPDDRAIDTVESGPNGYEFETAPGMVEVHVSARGYQSTDTSVDLRGGETKSADFALRKIDAGITGTCLDASTGQPLRGVRVDVYSNSWPAHVAETDAAGRFRLDVPAGTYRVLARKDGHGPVGIEKVEIGAGKLTEVNVRVFPNNASISVQLRDRASGKAITEFAEAFITSVALAPEKMMFSVDYPEVEKDAATKVFKAAVAPGKYLIRARARGFLDLEVPIEVGSGEARLVPVALEARPPVEATLKGVVRTASGAPFANGNVWISYRNHTMVVVRTAADGSFEAKVPAVKLRVRPLGQIKAGKGSVLVAAETSVTPEKGKVVEVSLTVKPVKDD